VCTISTVLCVCQGAYANRIRSVAKADRHLLVMCQARSAEVVSLGREAAELMERLEAAEAAADRYEAKYRAAKGELQHAQASCTQQKAELEELSASLSREQAIARSSQQAVEELGTRLTAVQVSGWPLLSSDHVILQCRRFVHCPVTCTQCSCIKSATQSANISVWRRMLAGRTGNVSPAYHHQATRREQTGMHEHTCMAWLMFLADLSLAILLFLVSHPLCA